MSKLSIATDMLKSIAEELADHPASKPHKVEPPQWVIDKVEREQQFCDALSKHQAERVKT